METWTNYIVKNIVGFIITDNMSKPFISYLVTCKNTGFELPKLNKIESNV